jgi:hypothetical protein
MICFLWNIFQNTMINVVKFAPMRPKASGLAQQGGPLGWLEESNPASVIMYVMYGSYCLPLHTTPVALTGIAQLRADEISSCCYTYNTSKRGCRHLVCIWSVHLSLRGTLLPQRPKGVENWFNTASCCMAGGEGWGGGGIDLYSDGRAVPPAMTYCTACPVQELFSCELQAIPAATADGLLLNEHKRPTWLKSRWKGRGRHSMSSMTAPCDNYTTIIGLRVTTQTRSRKSYRSLVFQWAFLRLYSRQTTSIIVRAIHILRQFLNKKP